MFFFLKLNLEIYIHVIKTNISEFEVTNLAIHFAKYSVQAYLFNDYWEDIGTIRSFFEANLALTEHVSIKEDGKVTIT